MRKIWAVVCALALSGGMLMAQDKPAEQTPQEAAAAKAANEEAYKKAEAAGQLSTIVFYRPKRFVGSALNPSVYINGEQVARLDNGRFFVLKVQSGALKMTSSMKSHDPLEFEAKPGKVHFIEMAIQTGNWRGGGRLIPVGQNDARDQIKKLKPLDKNWVMAADRIAFDVPQETAATQ